MSTDEQGPVDIRSDLAPAGLGLCGQDGSAFRAWVEVDLEAVRHNVRILKGLAEPARVMAVVKADGYGHGAVAVSRAALEAGAAMLAVASAEEGVTLRRAGIHAPILVLGVGPAAPPQALARWQLTATVTHPAQVAALGAAARREGCRIPVHIEVETGMGRMGVLPERVGLLAQAVASEPGLQLEGVYTHLATADEPDLTAAHRQMERFVQALAELERFGIQVPLRHVLNTAGLLALPEWRLEMVRIGLGLYGLVPAEHLKGRVALRPALRLYARVLEVRRLPAGSPISYGQTYVTPAATTIATLGVGYADGFTRRLSGRARGVMGGRVYPVVGRICMDQCMLDVGDDPVQVGDVVCLVGPGEQGEMTLDEAAALTGTISYEIMTQLGARLPRVYREGTQP